MKRLSEPRLKFTKSLRDIIVDVPKLLKWVQEKSMYPAQETRKAKLRKLLSSQ